MDDGLAVKETIVGAVEVDTGGGELLTVTVTDLVAVPPALLAVKV
jgi:hypothetical protein